MVLKNTIKLKTLELGKKSLTARGIFETGTQLAIRK